MSRISSFTKRVAKSSRKVKPLGDVFRSLGYERSQSGARRILVLSLLIPAGIAVVYPFLFMGGLYVRYGPHIFK